MTDEPTLLPDPTAWERALSAVLTGQGRLPAGLLPTIFDPVTCPPEFLPFLARDEGVALWSADWPVTKRRAVIAAWRDEIKYQIGTVGGLRKCLAIVDCALQSAVGPQPGYVLGKSMTEEERARWLALHPELRLYRYRRPYMARGLIGGRARTALGTHHAALMPDPGPVYGLPRSTIVDGGVEVELVTARLDATPDQTVSADDVFEVRRRRPLRGVILSAGYRSTITDRPLVRDRGADYVYRLTVTRDVRVPGSLDYAADVVVPALEPLEARATRVYGPAALSSIVVGHARRSVLGRSHIRQDRGRYEVYDALRLWDVNRPPPPRPGRGAVIGRSVLGVPRHNLIVTTEVSSDLPRRTRVPGHRLSGYGFRAPFRRDPAPDRWAEALAATRAGKRLSDRVLVQMSRVGVKTIGRSRIGDGFFGDRAAIV